MNDEAAAAEEGGENRWARRERLRDQESGSVVEAET